VGTLGGYSAIWLARGLAPGGRLVTLEADPKHAEVARKNVARAGLAAAVDIRVGLALDLFPSVEGPFDLAFIDADKINNANYFDWALRLSHVGSVIVIDNVVRKGQVTDASSTDPGVVGVRRLNERIMKEPRVSATTLQTVGHKGYDGFTLVRVERA
jgi:predicted O-methyltransferase YrrM